MNKQHDPLDITIEFVKLLDGDFFGDITVSRKSLAMLVNKNLIIFNEKRMLTAELARKMTDIQCIAIALMFSGEDKKSCDIEQAKDIALESMEGFEIKIKGNEVNIEDVAKTIGIEGLYDKINKETETISNKAHKNIERLLHAERMLRLIGCGIDIPEIEGGSDDPS